MIAGKMTISAAPVAAPPVLPEIVTQEALSGMQGNFAALFGFLHPGGIRLQELERKAGEHNFYRHIYQHVKEAADGQHSMEY